MHALLNWFDHSVLASFGIGPIMFSFIGIVCLVAGFLMVQYVTDGGRTKSDGGSPLTWIGVTLFVSGLGWVVWLGAHGMASIAWRAWWHPYAALGLLPFMLFALSKSDVYASNWSAFFAGLARIVGFVGFICWTMIAIGGIVAVLH